MLSLLCAPAIKYVPVIPSEDAAAWGTGAGQVRGAVVIRSVPVSLSTDARFRPVGKRFQ